MNIHEAAQQIRDAGNDWERAHIAEDEMMRSVLDAIATDQTDGLTPKELAFRALLILAEFADDQRWYA